MDYKKEKMEKKWEKKSLFSNGIITRSPGKSGAN